MYLTLPSCTKTNTWLSFRILRLTYIQWRVLFVDMVIDVWHSQRLDGSGPDAEQNLSSDEQKVHHVGVGSVAAVKTRVPILWPGFVGADDPAVLGMPRVPCLVLILMSQELWQSWEQRPQCHDDPPTANQPGPVGLGAKVADKQDQGQVADFKAAGDDAHIGTLEVKTSLESRQNTYLAGKQINNECYRC